MAQKKSKYYGKGKNNKRSMKNSPNNRFNKDVAECDVDVRSKGSNDPSWYAENADLLRDAGSFSYSWPLGNQIDLEAKDVTSSFDAVPGLMTLPFIPTIGKSTGNYSPINISARNIYSFVRHANSGHSNYDSPDLMMYLIAMDSMYMMHSYLRRLYGIARLYTATNRYYPDALLRGNYIDPGTVRTELADLRYWLNTFAVKLGSMCVPSSMSYIARHMWMCDNVYVDDPNSGKAQSYMFVPHGFWKLNNVQPTGTALEWVDISTNVGEEQSWRIVVQKVEEAMQVILGDEDMNIMSGDILKAFGPEGVVRMYSTEEGYTTLPIFSAEVLVQIQNSIIMEEPSVATLKITQDPGINEGAILFDPRLLLSNFNLGLTGRRLISMPVDNVDPSLNMVATRLTPAINGWNMTTEGDTEYYYTASSFGTEIITRGRVWTFVDRNGEWTMTAGYITSEVSASTAAGVIFPELSRINQFAYHPIVYVEQGNVSTLKCQVLGVFTNLNNYTLMDHTDLDKMHETALISEFSVPQMGRFATKTM